ncbi:MAG: class I tRNA ligase family protein, partial [Clostridia bacterium]|nr:class I tRNA ligase family protein [Clostridia bacterium]
ITFWVSRMIFSGIEHMDEKPFSTVFIHGLVRDAQGRKMSKSLGNGIDPLEVIKQYGADALRFALATGNSPGNDMRFSDEKIEAARNFANKLWNASRFVRMNLTIDEIKLPEADNLALEDKWILNEFNALCENVVTNLDNFEVGVALGAIYSFAWDIFCDWYIELCKARLNEKDTEANAVCQNVIAYVLRGILKLLHPFMPFITEEIYQALPHECESIMISDYPKACDSLAFSDDAEKMTKIIDAIKAIRTRRSEMNVAPSKKAKVYVATKYTDIFAGAEAFFSRLASASELIVANGFAESEVSADNAVQIITDAATIFLPLSDIIDFEKEKARLEGEKKRLEGEIERIEKKLSNQGFVAKAPAAVVEGERAKMAKYRENLEGVLAALAKLG